MTQNEGMQFWKGKWNKRIDNRELCLPSHQYPPKKIVLVVGISSKINGIILVVADAVVIVVVIAIVVSKARKGSTNGLFLFLGSMTDISGLQTSQSFI